MVQCRVHQHSRVMSFLCTGRCGASRWRKKLTSQPQGRDARSRTHRIVLYTPGALVQRRSRALRLYPSRIPWIASAVVCQASTRVSCRWIYDPQPFQCTALDPRPSAFPVHGVGFTTLSLSSARRWIYDPQSREHFATHQPDWNCGTAPPLGASGKERPKTVPATNVQPPRTT